MTQATMTVDDLREMDDALFNRTIAEADGWTNMKLYTDWYAVKNMGRSMNVLHGHPTKECADEDQMVVVPDYADDLNAAWQLAAWQHVAFTTHDDGLLVTAHDGQHGTICATGTHKPARALATAWWELRETWKGGDA